jgi:hypothetical protein
MHLMLNTWFPTWLDGRRPKKTAYTYVDSIGYVAQPRGVARDVPGT